ncbi:MAG: HAD family phosphatase [Fidelibacterota bacterium]|nr:MAG: HAD family phosphatase [Candidatus Neomarinimicrobiota bacterium]
MSDHPAITTIFFDIGGVLVEVNERGGMDEIVRLTGLAPEWLGSRMAGENLYALERGEVTLRDYHAAAFKDAGANPPITYDRFEQFWTELLLEPTSVADILPALRRQAAVWFLTNTNQVHMDYLKENYRFMAQADGVISSHQVGHRKPDREIFRLALRRADVPAEQALFVDDKVDNVAAARELGIAAHQYVDLPGLVGFLGEHGLEAPPPAEL